jgi:chromate transporter
MAKSLCPDRQRVTLAVLAAAVVATMATSAAQLAVIVAGGLAGVFMLKNTVPMSQIAPNAAVGRDPIESAPYLSRRRGIFLLLVFAALLVALPWLASSLRDSQGGLLAGALQLASCFYKAGALVFGGGHVVLPLLATEVVAPGFVSHDLFLAGYGAAQALPGPLFTVAAFLGAVAKVVPSGASISSGADGVVGSLGSLGSLGAVGSVISTIAIFLPGMLILFGVMPFWQALRRFAGVQAAMRGVNAAVVGILLAAFYQPVWTTAILRPLDFVVAVFNFVLLVWWRWPPWLVVLMGALSGPLLAG